LPPAAGSTRRKTKKGLLERKTSVRLRELEKGWQLQRERKKKKGRQLCLRKGEQDSAPSLAVNKGGGVKLEVRSYLTQEGGRSSKHKTVLKRNGGF